MSTIYTLGLHEELNIDRYNVVKRVPGGWLYKSFTGTEEGNFTPIGVEFVPYHEEYLQISGCTDPEANNYNPLATIDDDSCTYDVVEGSGRTQ
jgi:hypothetical protein